MSLLNDLENELEQKAAPTSDEEKLIVTDLGKQQRWLDNRRGKITSSTLSDLMKGGRAKTELWGKVAIKVMYAVKYERRTGLTLENKDYIKNFQFGHENELKAVEWLRENGYDIQTSEDFDEVIFNVPFSGFGDSPDGQSSNGDYVDEIKCPVDQAKFEELRDLKEIDSKNEYYGQFIGHFIGAPKAQYLRYTIYDTFSNDANVIIMKRSEHVQAIADYYARIIQADKIINESLKTGKTINELVL